MKQSFLVLSLCFAVTFFCAKKVLAFSILWDAQFIHSDTYVVARSDYNNEYAGGVNGQTYNNTSFNLNVANVTYASAYAAAQSQPGNLAVGALATVSSQDFNAFSGGSAGAVFNGLFYVTGGLDGTIVPCTLNTSLMGYLSNDVWGGIGSSAYSDIGLDVIVYDLMANPLKLSYELNGTGSKSIYQQYNTTIYPVIGQEYELSANLYTDASALGEGVASSTSNNWMPDSFSFNIIPLNASATPEPATISLLGLGLLGLLVYRKKS